MQPSPIFQTKFLPPRQNATWLPRSSLLKRMKALQGRRVLLISAPAGFGKTTLLSLYLTQWDGYVAWFQIDARDNDPSIFLSHLNEALRQAYARKQGEQQPDFSRATASLLSNLEAHPATFEQVLGVLLNELFEVVTEPWMLVLEDYHLVTNPQIHQMVDYIILNAPPDMQIVLSSRTTPPLRLARLRAQGLLAELHGHDLRFTWEEIRAWFQSEGMPPLSEATLHDLERKTGGWAAALQIIRSSIQGQGAAEAERFIAEISGSHRVIFDYLAEEIFQRLPQEWQDFLVNTAILERMDGPTCDFLLQRSNSCALLEQLEDANLCLANYSGTTKWFYYHQLIREFLLGKLRREAHDRIATLEQRAAAYYEQQGAWEWAFNHYLQGANEEKAAEVLERFAQDFVERGRVEVLNRYLSQLPRHVLYAHPELLLQKGNVLRRLGEIGAATAIYKEARWRFERYGDRAGICRSLTRLAEVNYSQGHYQRARELATEALQQATADDHAERAYALMALAKSEGFLVGMEGGRRLAEQALQEAQRAGDSIPPTAKANLLQALGQICWWHGDPEATIRYCEEALAVSPEPLTPTRARTYITLVSPYLYRQNLEKALAYAEEGLNIAQTLHLVELLPSAYAVLGNVLTRLGEIVRAENSLRQAMETAQQLGFASYERVMATGYLAYNLVVQNRLEEAQQLIESALWTYTGPMDTYDVFVCRSVMADIALEKDDLAEARALYQALLPTGEKHQFRIPLSMVHFGLAYIALRQNRLEEGLAHARKSLELIEQTQMVQLYLDQGKRGQVVCRALAENGYDSPFVQRVLTNLQHPEHTVQVSLKHQGVAVQTLGAFRVMVNGEEITKERWVSTKARDLLAYFITFRGERIPAERAFDALWQDRAGRQKTAFHTALSRLRKALRGQESTVRYILLENGEYWLDTARFVLDVDEFEASLKRAKESLAPQDALPWYRKAVSVYKGEYLPSLYYEWVFPEQRRLQQEHTNALLTLGKLLLTQNEPEEAIAYLQMAVDAEPLNEDGYGLLMEAYGAMGHRGKVQQIYQQLRQRLQEELGVAPLPATQQIYQRLMK